jgi:pseudaminic acid biosynthesis-associated methylase
MNKQEIFWSNEYSHEYIKRNESFDLDEGIKAWSIMLRNAEKINSLLELGSNIGRNINILRNYLPNAKKSIVEISPEAFSIVTGRYELQHAKNCSIMEADFKDEAFDLVFTTGVLIHIAPENLLLHIKKMYELSKRYILICEMFSRIPKAIHYRNSDDLLFTRDYGRYFLENLDLRVVDYGFLWGHYFDDAGFDDGNWWLFEKRN